MKFNLVQKSEVEKARLDRQIIHETAGQVISDFANFGMDISFPKNLDYAYDSLFEQLKIVICDLLQKDPEKLFSLLYQIDLDEKKLKESKALSLNQSELLSEMILEREYIKVITSHYFKKKI